MYPFKPGHRFTREHWYVAALSHELDGEMLERRIFDEPVLLYRAGDEHAVAMAGLCPHRRMPLAMGRRVGDAIQCAYHGITFGADGACLRIPTQSSPGSQMRVRTYPAVERWKWVWIWTGDPAHADPNLIPNHHEIGLRDDWAATPAEHYPVAARFQLLIENLQNLSHINYLHGAYVEDAACCEAIGPARLPTSFMPYPNREAPRSQRVVMSGLISGARGWQTRIALSLSAC